jgi:hypothetical protein
VVLAQLGQFAEAIEAIALRSRSIPRSRRSPQLGIALYKTANFVDAATELAAVRAAQPDNLQARISRPIATCGWASRRR